MGKAGRGIETGRHQVEVFAHANHVGIGVIGMQDGILIGAIAIVGYPDLGELRDAAPRKQRTGQETEAGSREGGYGLHRRAKNSIMPGLTLALKL